MFKWDLRQLLLEGCVVGLNNSIQNYIRCQSSNEADTELLVTKWTYRCNLWPNSLPVRLNVIRIALIGQIPHTKDIVAHTNGEVP